MQYEMQIRAVSDSIGLQRAFVFVHSLPHSRQIVVRGFYGHQDANPTSMMDKTRSVHQYAGGTQGWRPFSVEQCAGVGIRTIAPTLGQTLMSRSDSSDFIASRMQVRLTPNLSMSSFSVGNFSPGFT